MITFRWLILRLFWSLFLLPVTAYPLLWLLHEVVFSGVYFPDFFLIAILWGLLFMLTSFILTRIGARRFAELDRAGREALANNRDEQSKEVFKCLQTLFSGGLLSLKFQEKQRRRLLRHYFPFYAAAPQNTQHREQLLVALREGIRAHESYETLKAYVLQQPALTASTIDLAEALLEHRPADGDLLDFLTRHYLREQKTHYRAEYIYTQSLAKGRQTTPAIVSLCLNRVLRLQRRDDFALWVYARGFELGEALDSNIRHLLYEAHKRFQRHDRHDALAEAVAQIVDGFTEEEIARWLITQQAVRTKSLSFQAARLFFHFQQWLLEVYSRLRERRKWVYLAAGGAAVLAAVYLTIATGVFKTHRVAAVETEPEEDPNAVYFSLQVSALRRADAAQREAERLRQQGLEAHLLKPETTRGWHRVRVGKYRSRRAAQTAADSLKAAGIIRDYFVANYEKQ